MRSVELPNLRCDALQAKVEEHHACISRHLTDGSARYVVNGPDVFISISTGIAPWVTYTCPRCGFFLLNVAGLFVGQFSARILL